MEPNQCWACSYAPAKRPNVFCPACGAVWYVPKVPLSPTRRAPAGEGERKVPSRAKTVAVNYDDMIVTELKDELRDHGLPVSGNRAELIERLTDEK